MQWVFYTGYNKHEVALCEALRSAGVNIDFVSRKQFRKSRLPDVSVLAGVKGRANEIIDTISSAGKFVIFFDKGYVRANLPGSRLMEHYRVSINAPQPHAYMDRYQHRPARWEALGIRAARPKKRFGKGSIVFCGSSQKYCNFHRLGDATKYAEQVISSIAANDRCARRIVYRPKPSWDEAVPVAGADFSRSPRHLGDELKTADLVVTHGSNACFEAMLSGVPALVLGDGITKILNTTSLQAISNIEPFDTDAFHNLCYNIAYQQWSLDEIRSGEAVEYWYSVFRFLGALYVH